MQGRFVSYLRVSTDRQGRSGLGLEAQRMAVQAYLNGGNWTLLDTMIEVESGKVNARPELARALALCRLTGATLIVAKLDRLSRNARFLLSVIEGTGEAGVTFCDFPTIPPGPVGKFILTQMAAVAELARIIHEKCAVKAKPVISFTTMRMGCLMKFFAMKSLAQVFGGLGRFRAVR